MLVTNISSFGSIRTFWENIRKCQKIYNRFLFSRPGPVAFFADIAVTFDRNIVTVPILALYWVR